MARFNMAAEEVVSVLQRSMLADGFHLVIDLERSHGSWIYDAVNHRELLDFYSYFASLPIGHNHPGLVENAEFMQALTRAAVANPANSDIYTREMAAAVEIFAELACPEELPHLFFVAGGALAVENALKAAFDWKVRRNRAAGRGDLGSRVIHFREAFHGRSGYTMSLTNTDPVKTDGFPIFDWPRIVNPKLEHPVTPEVVARVERLEAQAVQEIEQAFAEHPHDIAAIIIEPIQGEGGDNHFRTELFQHLRRLADAHEALLIFDEIQTGLGLTGAMWAWQHFGVAPDILAFGKKTQVCGIMAGRRIEEVEGHVFTTSGRINSTWGGNLVDMVRGGRYLEIVHDEGLVDNAARMGARLLVGLDELATRHQVVSNVRGRGLMTAFNLPDTRLRDRYRALCWEQGLATLSSGPRSIRFRPCLTVRPEEIDTALEILDTCLGRLET